MTKPPPYVASMASGEYRIVGLDALKPELSKLGLKWASDGTALIGSGERSDEAVAAMADALRSLGLAFSAGPGWSPSDLFQHFRDTGLLVGDFTEIFWTDPERWAVRIA